MKYKGSSRLKTNGVVPFLVCYALPPNVELTDLSSAAHIAVATYGDAASLAPDDH